ncbi:MAG: hypothetical protein LBT50_10180 [Prevotellaceae bacterium]|nr:hypothetical protein [Prevotellaceae bacterium]
MNEWVGKTIKFPDIQPIIPYTRVENVSCDKEYKILLYTDTIGCTSCNLQIHLWKAFIEKYGYKTDFLFYFYPKDREDILSFLKREQFNYRVYIDNVDEINKLNHFYTNPVLQCFLLDKTGYILTYSETYPGKYISCKQGNGNCWNGTDCIKD